MRRCATFGSSRISARAAARSARRSRRTHPASTASVPRRNAEISMTLKSLLMLGATLLPVALHAANPIITDAFTADPAPLVVGDTGLSLLRPGRGAERPPRKLRDEPLALLFVEGHATWKPRGRHSNRPTRLVLRRSLGLSGHRARRQVLLLRRRPARCPPQQGHRRRGFRLADGPFKDARGSALVTNNMTTATRIAYDDIDPHGLHRRRQAAWLFWGNQKCYYAKLKPNMTELDGPIQVIPDAQVQATPRLRGFTSARASIT